MTCPFSAEAFAEVGEECCWFFAEEERFWLLEEARFWLLEEARFWLAEAVRGWFCGSRSARSGWRAVGFLGPGFHSMPEMRRMIEISEEVRILSVVLFSELKMMISCSFIDELFVSFSF